MTPGQSAPVNLGALSSYAPEVARALVRLSGDIALVIDDAGVIRDIAIGDDVAMHATRDWVGRPWVETATGETRRKVELLLQEVGGSGVARRREINHPVSDGPDMPISYAALRLGDSGPVIAVGRDMRAVSLIQQRLIDAQQEMERGYWKLRQEQAHQRLLAQVASDAVLVVDGDSLAVIQFNAAAAELFGPTDVPLAPPVAELLAMASRSGRPAEVRARLGHDGLGAQVDLSAMPFRAAASDGSLPRLLVRARPLAAGGDRVVSEVVVITDSVGHVTVNSPALRALCRIRATESPVGRSLVDLLGDPQRHLASLLVDARRNGLARQPAVLLGGGRVPTYTVEVAATLLSDGDQECIGLTLSHVDPATPMAWASTLQALLDQVGAVPLAELMRRATELAERGAIEVALRRSASDARAAAVALGIDDADFELRLKRLGLARE